MALLFIPNILWSQNLPQGYSPEKENRILLVFERVGQITTSSCALLFSDFNLHAWTNWSWWLIASFALMILYEIWWIRYFRSGKTLRDFYNQFLGIPVPGAILPTLAFFFLGIYGKVVWMLLSVVILGIGHVGIHWQHKKELAE